MSHVNAIQAELDRLTKGHVQAHLAESPVTPTACGYAVQIGDEQGGGEYDPPEALRILKALASEGDDDRDALWSALEAAEIDSGITGEPATPTIEELENDGTEIDSWDGYRVDEQGYRHPTYNLRVIHYRLGGREYVRVRDNGGLDVVDLLEPGDTPLGTLLNWDAECIADFRAEHLIDD